MRGALQPERVGSAGRSGESPRSGDDLSPSRRPPFGKAGYSLTVYNEKWMTPNGLGEMAVADTRSFSGGRLHLSAVPFQTGSDAGVDDHRKYLAVSTHTFSLLDAFPFQHPEAPDLSVSIPVGDASGRGAAGRARLFGQGAGGSLATSRR